MSRPFANGIPSRKVQIQVEIEDWDYIRTHRRNTEPIYKTVHRLFGEHKTTKEEISQQLIAVDHARHVIQQELVKVTSAGNIGNY